MAKQRLKDLAFGQWFLIVAPSIACSVVLWFSRHELTPRELLYVLGGGLGLSLLLLFLNVYGEDL